MRKKILYLILFLYLLIPVNMNAQQGEEQSTIAIPEEFLIVIEGRLCNKDNSPIIDKEIFLHELSLVDGIAMVELKWDKTKCVGPRTSTDSLGNFKFELDKRSWEKKTAFALGVPIDFKEDIGITGYRTPVEENKKFLFLGPNDEVIMVAIDTETKIKNLGNITLLK